MLISPYYWSDLLLTCRFLLLVAIETRAHQTRLEAHDEQLKKLHSDVAEIKSTLKTLEVDRVESGEFRKIVLGWMKNQESKASGPSDETSGSGTLMAPPVRPPFFGSKSPGDELSPPRDRSDCPWAVKKVKLLDFSGFDPQGWIQKAQLYFDIHGTPINLRLRLAQLSMVGVAQHWFTVVTQVHTSLTWEQFQRELLQRFSGLEIQNPYEQLAAISQSVSIYDYIDDFEYLFSLVPRLPESQALGYFIAGLRTEVKKWVCLHRPKS